MVATPQSAVKSTKGNKTMAGHRMSADQVYFWANWILVGALVLGLLSTYAIVVSGNIKEANLKRELKDKDTALEEYKVNAAQRIADANSAAEAAKEGAAKASERAAELGIEAEKLKSQLAWRSISPDAASKLAGRLSAQPSQVSIQSVSGDPEAQ
jgi:hypothetical protein